MHVRVTGDGWLVCMYKMCRRGLFMCVEGGGLGVGERGGMCLCARGAEGTGRGFVDQQPMTGCHTLTHTGLPNQARYEG